MTTPVDLLDAIRTHLASFELPAALASVTLTTSTCGDGQVGVQLAAQDGPEIAAALLSWADTLTEPAAEAWRVPDGCRVHLAVKGRLPQGAPVRVYSAVSFTDRSPGADLDPGSSAPVLLARLRTWAALAEVPA